MSKLLKRNTRFGLALTSLILFLLLWQSILWITHYPAFILPAPKAVIERLVTLVNDGSLWQHTKITLQEALTGLALGTLTAMLLGYALAHSPAAERFLTPYIVASQSVPVIAIAPLLVIWFGTGLLSKALVCALIVFFPILVNTVVGLRSVQRSLHDLMKMLQASRWQILWLLEVPAGLPVLLSGLKMGATLAIIGAVVGEFVASDQGLGYLLKQGQQLFDTPLIFVGIGTLVLLAQILYGIVALLEQSLLRGQATSL